MFKIILTVASAGLAIPFPVSAALEDTPLPVTVEADERYDWLPNTKLAISGEFLERRQLHTLKIHVAENGVSLFSDRFGDLQFSLAGKTAVFKSASPRSRLDGICRHPDDGRLRMLVSESSGGVTTPAEKYAIQFSEVSDPDLPSKSDADTLSLNVSKVTGLLMTSCQGEERLFTRFEGSKLLSGTFVPCDCAYQTALDERVFVEEMHAALNINKAIDYEHSFPDGWRKLGHTLATPGDGLTADASLFEDWLRRAARFGPGSQISIQRVTSQRYTATVLSYNGFGYDAWCVLAVHDKASPDKVEFIHYQYGTNKVFPKIELEGVTDNGQLHMRLCTKYCDHYNILEPVVYDSQTGIVRPAE